MAENTVDQQVMRCKDFANASLCKHFPDALESSKPVYCVLGFALLLPTFYDKLALISLQFHKRILDLRLRKLASLFDFFARVALRLASLIFSDELVYKLIFVKLGQSLENLKRVFIYRIAQFLQGHLNNRVLSLIHNELAEVQAQRHFLRLSGFLFHL